jgi:hypothetical protein
LDEFKKQTSETEISVDFEKIFYPIKSNVITQLYSDPFTRFTRTKECLMISKLYKEKCCEAITVYKFPFTDKDFEQGEIYPADVSFFQQINKDTYDWCLTDEKDEKKLNVFYNYTNFLPKTKFFPNSISMKYQKIFELNIKECVSMLFSLNNKYKYQNEILEIYEENEKKEKKEKKEEQEEEEFKEKKIITMDIIKHAGDKKTLLLKTQEFKKSQVVSYEIDLKNQSILQISKPYRSKKFQSAKIKTDFCIDKEKKSKKKKEVKVYFEYEFIYLKKISEECTQYTEINIFSTTGKTIQQRFEVLERCKLKKKFLNQMMENKEYENFDEGDLFLGVLNKFDDLNGLFEYKLDSNYNNIGDKIIQKKVLKIVSFKKKKNNFDFD